MSHVRIHTQGKNRSRYTNQQGQKKRSDSKAKNEASAKRGQ